MSTQYTAAICLHGHLISGAIERSGVDPFCSDCGSAVISACPNCEVRIRGDQYNDRDMEVSCITTVPSFCVACATEFPWTKFKRALAEQLADEAELSPTDRETVKQDLLAISRKGPEGEVAAVRLKRLLSKLPGVAGETLRKITTEIATEALKRFLFG